MRACMHVRTYVQYVHTRVRIYIERTSRCGVYDILAARPIAIQCVSMRAPHKPTRTHVRGEGASWLRTNGVNTSGPAAKVINFVRLRKKVRPWHFWEDNSRLTGLPKKSLCQKPGVCSDPISADPICPSPSKSYYYYYYYYYVYCNYYYYDSYYY